MKKKILCLLLALLVINLSIPHVAWAADEKPTSGNCGAEGDGSNVKWNLDSEGTLTISGSGEMKDYFTTDKAPWHEHIENIKSVTIAPDVTSIGNHAFEECKNLTSVTIPEGVTSIGHYAFENCTNLTSVTIPESVTYIGSHAFSNCTGLTSVTIPDSVNYIGGNAFYGTKWLDQQREKNGPLVVVNNILIDGKAAEGEVSIPKDVTSIGDYAFRDCKKLISVTIPESVTSIGDSAFEKCTGLTSVTIPNGVTSIKRYTFQNCTGLTSVTIPDNVRFINGQAFENCYKLESVTIPKNVTSIENYAFAGCSSLKTFFYKRGLDLVDAKVPSETARIAYDVHDQQDGSRTKVKLVNTSENVTIKCDAMGERYEIIDNGTTQKDKKVTIEHYLPDDWNKGDGEKHWRVCTVCGAEGTKFEHTFEQKSGEGKHWEECNVCHEKQNEGQHTFEQKSGEDEHWKVCSICKKVTERGMHNFIEDTIGAMENKLGGTKCTCKDCGYVYWKDFKRGDNMATQIFMPNDEKIHLYCERNGLMVKAEVDVGGKKLEVFLLDPLGVLKKNDSDVLGISVTYVEEGSVRYNELMSLLDGDYPIEHINFFEVRPKVNEETKYGPLDSVYMMYEIPEGWDESDLEMILVQNGDDQEFDEEVVEMNGKKYLVMWKNHFSPYAMIDKLTDEERAALIAQQVESMDSTNSGESTDNSKYLANQVKTGDNSMSTVLMSTVILITAGLFLEVCIKRKRFCYTILTD